MKTTRRVFLSILAFLGFSVNKAQAQGKSTMQIWIKAQPFNAGLLSNGGAKRYSGEIPLWFPVLSTDAESIFLEINPTNGQILNWNKPTEEDLAIFQ